MGKKWKVLVFLLSILTLLNFFYYDIVSECTKDYSNCAWKARWKGDKVLKKISKMVVEKYQSIEIEDKWATPHSYLTPEDKTKLNENKCKIPIFNAFDETMVKFFWPSKKDSVDCENQNRTFYFKTSIDENELRAEPGIIMTELLPDDMECCFEHIRFEKKYGYKSLPTKKNESNCQIINRRYTNVRSDYQYVIINCWKLNTTRTSKSVMFVSPHKASIIHKELLIFVAKPSQLLLKNKTRLLRQRRIKDSESHPKMNVIILGFDQTSRLNFIRQMRKSYTYLKTELDACDLQGFNKVGDATLNNTLAFLTGLDFGDVIRDVKLWDPKKRFFDKLPFIWKKYAERGYITSYGDDYISVFDYRFRGFEIQPTDYYLHPFIKWLRSGNSSTKPLLKFSSISDCIGNERMLDLLQNYALKTASSLKDFPYFQFLWNSGIHEKPGYPSVMDKELLSTLKYFQESGILNKSMLIMLSDHGWRAGKLLMENHQARIENRMSFGFILLPKWFRNVYPMAYANLKENQYRLTTPYDIHATLVDMLDPDSNLKDEVLNQKMQKSSSRSIVSGKSTSLFLPISKDRSCTSAGIDEEWCACSTYKKFPVSSKEAFELANFAIRTLNSWLTPFKSCKQYSLSHVINAEVKVSSENSTGAVSNADLHKDSTFRIVFQVAGKRNPAVFEVVVFAKEGWLSESRNISKATGLIRMSTEVFRLSYYGSSGCIPIYSLKKICTCKSKKRK